MNWNIFLDSPIALGLLAGIPAVLMGATGFSVGLVIGRSQASEVAKQRIRDKQQALVEANSLLSQAEIARADLLDTRRSMIGAVHHLAARLHKTVNGLVETVEEDVTKLLEAADQPTAKHRHERRKPA